MALKKPIRQSDGVVTEYHRILYIMQTLNRQTSIAVLSYVDEESRSSEIDVESGFSPYQKAKTFEFEYSPDITAESAYNLIKALPEFEGAEDV